MEEKNYQTEESKEQDYIKIEKASPSKRKIGLIIAGAIFIIVIALAAAFNNQIRSLFIAVPTSDQTVSISVEPLKGKTVDYVSKQAIEQVTVTVKGRQTISDKEGAFEISDLSAGTYKVELTAEGYNKLSQEVEVSADKTDAQTFEMVPRGKVVFVSNRDGKRALYTINYDGSGEEKLVERVDDKEDYSPIVSPHQRFVIFYSTREGKKDKNQNDQPNLYLIKLDGSDFRKIGDDNYISSVKWSLEGGYIGWTWRPKDSNNTGFSVYNMLSRKTIKFTPDENSNIYSYNFSRNDSLVAFSQFSSDQQNVGLFVSKPDGSDKKRILDKKVNTFNFNSDNNLEIVYYENSSKKQIVWYSDSGEVKESSGGFESKKGIQSPDKTLRAYIENRDGRSDVFISKPDGSEEKHLTEKGEVSSISGWSQNSKYILFRIAKQGESARYVVAADGGEALKITDEYFNRGMGI